MIQKQVSLIVWLDVKIWINILNIAFLWRLGNSDIVKKPEIQGWIMFVLYDLHCHSVFTCISALLRIHYTSRFFSEKN